MITCMKSYEIMTSYQGTKILPNVSMPSAEESSDPHLPHWSPWSQWPTPTLEESLFGTFEELLFGLLGGASTQEFNFCVFVRVSLSRLFVFCLVDFFARWVSDHLICCFLQWSCWFHLHFCQVSSKSHFILRRNVLFLLAFNANTMKEQRFIEAQQQSARAVNLIRRSINHFWH